jgi:thioredoxin reductase
MYDAIVVGGGPAGLQASLTLARMHRPTLMLDSGVYRNSPVESMHNFITNDGRRPGEFRSIVRAELAAYDHVEVRDLAATAVNLLPSGTFEVTLSDEFVAATRTVVLATGSQDVMPAIPGFAEQWGRTVYVCPFCHGHELSGKRVAIEDSQFVDHMVAMLTPIAGSVRVVPTVTAVSHSDDGLLVTSGSTSVVVEGLFAAPPFEQSAPSQRNSVWSCARADASRSTSSGTPACPASTPPATSRTWGICRCR